MKNQLSQRKNIRLSPKAYKNRIIHIIICTRGKTPLFANKDIAYSVRQQILNLSRLKQVKIYAHVIMPDHIHLLVSLGAWATPGDYLRNIKGNLSTFLRKKFNLRNIWQKGFYDHVMRKDEDLNSTVEYILNNPVRSGEVNNWKDYPWCGSDVFKKLGRGKPAPTANVVQQNCRGEFIPPAFRPPCKRLRASGPKTQTRNSHTIFTVVEINDIMIT